MLSAISNQSYRSAFKIQSLSSLTNLRYMCLERAELTDNSFQGLINLERLDLDQCLFKDFTSESFRHIPNLEFLSIDSPENFGNINFTELTRLKCLRIVNLIEFSFIGYLSLNKDLNGLAVSNHYFTKFEVLPFIFRNSTVNTLELEFENLEKFDTKWLKSSANLRNLSLCNTGNNLKCMAIDFSDLGFLESIYFENIKFESLDLAFEKLTNLKR